VFCSGAETPSVLPPSRAARPSCVFCRIAGGNEQPGGKANLLQYEVRTTTQAGVAGDVLRTEAQCECGGMDQLAEHGGVNAFVC